MFHQLLFAHVMLQRPTVSQSGPSKLPRSDHNSIIAKGHCQSTTAVMLGFLRHVKQQSQTRKNVWLFTYIILIPLKSTIHVGKYTNPPIRWFNGQYQLHCYPLLLSCGCASAKKNSPKIKEMGRPKRPKAFAMPEEIVSCIVSRCFTWRVYITITIHFTLIQFTLSCCQILSFEKEPQHNLMWSTPQSVLFSHDYGEESHP